MSGMRKAIADNMVRSFYEAPHASLITEVDVTGVLKLIQKEKEGFFARHGVKLTITSFVARAMIKALQEFPLLNSSLDDDTIVVKRFVNVGIAVSVEQGIMVPVIKHCQRMNLAAIAKALGEVSEKARSNRLSPDDVADGTITLTNFGMSGVAIGIPIIRYPEVAIVGIGATQKKVVALDDETFGVRSMMHISLTFDHRVLDGMYGCGFLNSLKKHLEEDLRIE
jgi:2-oxoglutarate dehydrogenase E2 component (dihydrolipoamide succinyltransferase)